MVCRNPVLLSRPMDFPAELKRQIARIERAIDLHVPTADTRPTRLHTAMRYSLQGGGKRLRPVLLIAAAELCARLVAGAELARGLDPNVEPNRERPRASSDPTIKYDERAADDPSPLRDPLPAAVAIECVHTYSLIHDDLPCMDNDDLRRGRPTAHKAFDEATALLAGDALLTHAFALLADRYRGDPALAHALTLELADAAGSRRLIGGQMEDLLAERRANVKPAELDFIHLNKTAAMIEAALVMGGRIGAADEATLSALRRLGRHLGLAFQIIDDVLDATADTAQLGKTAGKDAKAGKTTYVKLHGIEPSRWIAAEHAAHARAVLTEFRGDTKFLSGLIDAMASRTK